MSSLSLFLLRVDEIDPNRIFEFGEKEKERFDALRKQEDKLLFLGGRLLIKQYVSNQEILFLSNQKPYIPGAKKFSLSHTYPYVALLVGENENGVDIEKRERLESTHLEKCLAKSDQEFLGDLGKLWCLKEATYKCAGVGQFNPKEPFDIFNEDVVVYRGKTMHYRFPVHEDIVITVASENPIDKVDYQLIASI